MSQARTFAFVDLAGFTALTEVHGDEDAADLVERFSELAAAALGPEDRLVKYMGDAVMLTSIGPAAGVGLLQRLYAAFEREDNFPAPRSGVHHGAAVERNGDYFGSTVNITARVAAQASAGQVLATAPVAEAAGLMGVGATDLGMVALRNVESELQIFELNIGSRCGTFSIDPVCRMRIDHDHATGQLAYEGHPFWFCSMACASMFSADPSRYASVPAG